MTTKFYLRDSNADKPTALFCFVFIRGAKIKLYLGESTHPNNWNGEKQRVLTSEPNHKTINQKIKELQTVISDTYRLASLEFGDDFTEAQFKEIFLTIRPKKNSKGEKKVSESFFSLFDDFIDAESRSAKSKGKNKSESTKKQYTSTKNLISEFCSNLKIQNINKSFLDSFANFLFEEKENQDTSVHNRLNHIKGFLKWIESEKNTKIQKSALTYTNITKTESNKVALSIEEIQKIENLDLQNSTALAHSRDLFLLQFYTGRRYSDIQLLRKEHFRVTDNGRAFFDFHDQKTDKKISVPLPKVVLDLVAKYDMNFKTISLKSQIENIRELCKQAEINESIERLTSFNRETQREYCQKWELVGTHTARRSFITYAHSKGLTINEIAELTGQSLPIVQKYIVTSDSNRIKSMDKIFNF